MLPTIGVTIDTYPEYEGYKLREDYSSCVWKAGGLPLLLPDLPPEQAGAALDRLDGLLVTGGGDYPPQSYGREPYQQPTPRDIWELALTKEAWERGLPIFGICRGCQAMNIVLGGDLIVDIKERGGYKDHVQTEPRQETTHSVELTHPQLITMFGQRTIPVNSVHHQAADRIADELEVAALAPDGIVEGLLSRRADRFALGLQWHPEAMRQLEPFRALIAAAQEYARRRG